MEMMESRTGPVAPIVVGGQGAGTQKPFLQGLQWGLSSPVWMGFWDLSEFRVGSAWLQREADLHGL